MAGCCNVSARFVLMALGLVFWACAAGMIFLAVHIFDYIGPIKGIVDNYYLSAPAGVLIGLSILFICVGFIGCCGACKENRCLQIMFFTLLLLIVLMEITGAVLSIVYKDEVSEGIENGMNQAINKYSDEDDNIKESWDYMQTTLKCCGVQGYKDWTETPWGHENPQQVPESCCKKDAVSCEGRILIDQNKINQKGCHKALYDDINAYLGWIIGVAIVFALVQITGLLCTCVRIWSKRKESPYQVLGDQPPDTSGYRA